MPLIVEVGVKSVFPAVLLHYHPLAFEYGDEFYHLVAAECDTDRGVCFLQGFRKFLIAVFVFQGERRFQCDAVLPLGDVLVRVELLPVSFCLILVLEQVVFQQLGQCFLIDAECERFEVHRPDMCGFDRTYVGILAVLLHLQHRFRLVA